jgi:hypothetical protein
MENVYSQGSLAFLDMLMPVAEKDLMQWSSVASRLYGEQDEFI